jgi:hypothetical protein
VALTSRFGSGILLGCWLACATFATAVSGQDPYTDAASVPEPPLRPWYVARRYELSALGSLVLVLFIIDVCRNGRRASRGEQLRKVRVTVAVVALLVAVVWGLETHTRREDRRSWRRALHVAVILLERQTMAAPVSAAFLGAAADAMDFLALERRRHAPESTAPFWLHVAGPLPYSHDVADPPRADSLLTRASYAWDLHRELAAIDRAAGVASGRFDMRLYVLATKPASYRGARFVEGFAEAGGEVGIVRVDLDEKMIGTAWSAVLHELLHAVGAQDKYDERGRAIVPVGLAEPDRTPRYPQRRAEVMAGDIPLGDGRSRLPTGFSELSIGRATAQEIGWLR